MAPIASDVRMLVAVRVVVLTTLLLASLIIQYTAGGELPIDYLYATAGITYLLTLLYIALAQWVPSRTVNLAVQTGGDLLVETLLVYFTGGLDSPFSFLYLVSIITASMLLYRRGGLIAASGAAILYGTLADLLFYGIIPLPEETLFAPTWWTSSRLYLNLATNFAGFYATALLTSIISEKLQRTSENLAALRALNQNVVNSISSGIITLTDDGTVTFANPAAGEILRQPPADLPGRHVTSLDFVDSDEWEEIVGDLTGSSSVRREKELAVAGETRSVGFALTPLRTIEGASAGYTLIFQDLTEMKALEAELRLKDRMAAVGELSAGIAHEIRNPLAAITGSAQVLRNSGSLTPQEQRLMTIVVKESERLNKSISEFLRFVRPQERRIGSFDVAASLAETLELLGNSVEITERHEIRRSIDPPSCYLVGDGDQIRQVFWNIARNAIQAMPGGGVLAVNAVAADGSYRIAFTDTGRGMDASDKRKLFQPFRTNFPTGTGLGMAISYRIVQDHGGRIDVTSAVGQGTTITVVLPMAPAVGSRASLAIN